MPFAERVNVAEHLRTLNNWAKHVQAEIDRNAHRQKREGLPWSQWAAGMMVTVLQQDCGVRYNPQRIHDPDFRDSRDQFIHGMIVGDGGTCASMPVVYVAIGRRLGFPMKLVSAKAHLFARWDSPDARFNLEGAGMGFSIKPDEYYLTSSPRARAIPQLVFAARGVGDVPCGPWTLPARQRTICRSGGSISSRPQLGTTGTALRKLLATGRSVRRSAGQRFLRP
jgi:hypothetical protein